MKSEKVEIGKIATNLVQTTDGIWALRSLSLSQVSYPKDGNASCYQFEETSFWFRHRNRCILQILRTFPPQGTFFDIDGGNGFVAAALNEAGFETVLIELGEGVYNAHQRGVRIVIRSTLEDAGFLSSTLPAAGIFDVLEHVKDDVGFLRLLALLLQPGGRLYLTVPAFSWLWSVVDKDSGHYRRYSSESLFRILQQSGFAIEYLSGFFRFLIAPILLFRVFPSCLGLRKSQPTNMLHDELVLRPKIDAHIDKLLQKELTWLGKRSYKQGASLICVAHRQ